MTNIAKKRCGHPGCIKIPSFGNDGGKKAEFCSQYARQGMVDVRFVARGAAIQGARHGRRMEKPAARSRSSVSSTCYRVWSMFVASGAAIHSVRSGCHTVKPERRRRSSALCTPSEK
ncbi:unnamed protein product [Ectocarpus sp. 8 AP-2014]